MYLNADKRFSLFNIKWISISAASSCAIIALLLK